LFHYHCQYKKHHSQQKTDYYKQVLHDYSHLLSRQSFRSTRIKSSSLRGPQGRGNPNGRMDCHGPSGLAMTPSEVVCVFCLFIYTKLLTAEYRTLYIYPPKKSTRKYESRDS
jgi:hypothetical protein